MIIPPKGGVATSGVTAISQQSVDSSNASSVSGVGQNL